MEHRANLGNPGIADNRGLGCVECHADTGMIFSHAMSRRTAEQEFCQRSWGRADTTFYATNCQQVSCRLVCGLPWQRTRYNNTGYTPLPDVSSGLFCWLGFLRTRTA